MRVLITGAGGFVGHHLVQHIRQTSPEVELHGTMHGTESAADGIHFHSLDLRDEAATHALIGSIKPEHIYHLAGQASVPRSFEAPWDTLETNIRTQLNIFLACLAHQIKPRILITSSAEVYGAVTTVPIREDAPFLPANPYSVSKVTQDLLGLQYFLSHQLPVIRVRAFNHLGPGQDERFVAPAFAMQIARIETGQQEPLLRVGDLSDRRDFTDVRDVVRAYGLLMKHGTAGEAYNVASGRAHSIQYLLDTLLKLTSKHIEVMTDPARLRPSRIPVLQGDITRLQQATNWQPSIPFEQTLHDILDDCRARIARTVTNPTEK